MLYKQPYFLTTLFVSRDFNVNILSFFSVTAISALPATVLLILVDSWYFGYLTWDEILQGQITIDKNFVVTPYNFIQYNVYTSNLANHGLHPRITHLLVNIPVLYNVLGLAALFALCSICLLYTSRCV